MGGAGDKKSYYGTGPNHNVADVMKVFVRDMEAEGICSDNYDAHHIGYNYFISDNDLKKNVLEKITDVTTPVYIIGHSLGGWNGAHLSAVLTDKGYRIRVWLHSIRLAKEKSCGGFLTSTVKSRSRRRNIGLTSEPMPKTGIFPIS